MRKSDKTSEADHVAKLLAARSEDERLQQFNSAYPLFEARLFYFLERFDKNDATDLLQETLFRMYEHLGSLRSTDSFWSWAKHIAYNVGVTHAKKTKRNPVFNYEPEVLNAFALEGARTPADQLMQAETANAISEAIRKLDISEQELFSLFHIDDFSFRDIGTILNMSEDAVRVKCGRVRKKLRKYLGSKTFVEAYEKT